MAEWAIFREYISIHRNISSLLYQIHKFFLLYLMRGGGTLYHWFQARNRLQKQLYDIIQAHLKISSKFYFTLHMFISTPHTNCEPHFPKNWEILATSHVITAQTSLAPTRYLSKILHNQIFGPTKHGGKLFFYCKKNGYKS